MADNPIWERLASDTDKSFEAFCIYRDMGSNRSLDKAYAKYKGVSIEQQKSNGKRADGTFTNWASDHNWVERAVAYDDYMRDKLREQNESMRVQIEADALSDYHVIRKALAKRIALLEQTDYQSSPSDLHDLISLMEHANSYARLNSGLPDKITESKSINTNNNKHSGAVTLLSELSDDELDDILSD